MKLCTKIRLFFIRKQFLLNNSYGARRLNFHGIWRNFVRTGFIIAFLGQGLSSCDPNESLPPETCLEFRNYQFYVDADGNIAFLRLQIYFQDGDGNIGIEANEVGRWPFVGKFEDNLFVHVYDKLADGSYKPVSNGSLTNPEDFIISNRFPRLEPEGSSVKGIIDIDVGRGDIIDILYESEQGIIRFEIYMYDRDMVQSNIVFSPDIYFSGNLF